MKIGFIGVGTMGAPMAGHLQQGGHQLYLTAHRSPLPSDLVAGGAKSCGSVAEVAGQVDVLILMVPDTPDVENVLFGLDGATVAIRSGTYVVDMSSIDPISTRDFAMRVAAAGGRYLDAPVSGGEVGAKAASLTIMCGARAEDFESMRPLFELMGTNITHVGDVGAGQVAKVANQIIVALNIEAVAEALLFASRAGVDPAKVRDALMGGFATSRVLEVHSQRMIDRSFDPGFRIELHQKDLALALNGARSLGLALPNTASTQQLFSACVAQGKGQCDHSAIVCALERLAEHTMGQAA